MLFVRWVAQRYELKALGQPYAKDIREMDKLVKSEDVVAELGIESADDDDDSLTMALRDCSRTLQAEEKESYKRIWLFTADDHPAQGDKLARAVEDAMEAKVQIQLWYFNRNGKRPFDQSFYQKILSAGLAKASEGGHEESSRVVDNMLNASEPLNEVS